MTPLSALLVIAALIVLATAAGLVARARQGRVRRSARTDQVRPDTVGLDALGASATLVQFSTEMCARCPGVRRTLSALADDDAGIRYTDVDLTHRPDLAQQFNVLQTPTTLVLDGDGAIRARIGGVPRRDELNAELARLTGAPARV